MTVSNRIRHARETSVGWHIQRLTGVLDNAVTKALRAHDLTLPEFPILMTAIEHQGLTQADLATRFRRPAYAISRAIDALVEKGLLERRADPASRRSHNIHATKAAHALAPKLLGIIDTVNRDLLAPLDEAEADELLRLLAKTLNAT